MTDNTNESDVTGAENGYRPRQEPDGHASGIGDPASGIGDAAGGIGDAAGGIGDAAGGIDDRPGSPANGAARGAAGPGPSEPASESGDGPAAESGDGGASGTGDEAESSPPSAPKKKSKIVRELFTILAAAILLTVLLKLFVVQVYEIPSASMQNTLVPGDRVLVNKLVYHFRGIARGDIIVFSGAGSWGNLDGEQPAALPSNPVLRYLDDGLIAVGLRNDTTYYIKRVIGLPGDKVACCTSGLLTVNGVALHESSYLYPGDTPDADYQPFRVTVGSGQLFVMGDHRSDSSDSRFQGTIPENEVVGRAFFKIWPLSHFGDLPIPDTFKQPGLSLAASIFVTAPTVLLITRRRKRRSPPDTPNQRGES